MAGAEGIIIAAITGVLSLLGVIFTNIMSNRQIEHKLEIAQAVTDTKIVQLTEEVRKHNSFAEKIPTIETRVGEIERRVNKLES